MPDKDIDKIPITVEVPKADVWVRNDYRDIVQRLGEVHMIRACEHQFDDDWIPLYSIDVIAALQAEIERLQERCTEQAHWIDAAVSKCATQQCSRRAAQLLELQAEIKRLHADRDHWHEARRNAIEAGDELLREIERLRSDRREMLAQLRFIRTHLYAATVQRSPADDRIIADHIEQAYLRANEVIMEMEKSDV